MTIIQDKRLSTSEIKRRKSVDQKSCCHNGLHQQLYNSGAIRSFEGNRFFILIDT
jgi:hypothetical protein